MTRHGAGPSMRWRCAPLATSTSLVNVGPTPAFVLARVSPLAGGVAACVRKRQRKPGVCGPVRWLLRQESDGGPGTPAIVDVIRFLTLVRLVHSDSGPAVF